MEKMSLFGDETSESNEIKNNTKPILQRKYKDSVFTDAFSTKENLLDLYLTLHPERINVTIEDIESIRLDNVVFTNMYNDVAFKVKDSFIVLMEHQSTANYNMPLRMLFYVADEYRKSIKELDKNLYKRKLIRLPAPEFYVVYTGNEDFPEELHLSDAFESDAFMELNVKVIKKENINSMLGGYISFVKLVEENKEAMGNEKAILYAINYLKGKSKFSEYLKPREREVIKMLESGWDFEKEKLALAEEEREEGIRVLVNTLCDIGKPRAEAIELASQKYKVTEEYIHNILKEK